MSSVAADVRAMVKSMRDFTNAILHFENKNLKRCASHQNWLTKIAYLFKPRAKLTYWFCSIEHVVYVDYFKQKSIYQIVYKDINLGKQIMINSSTPITYRLEQLLTDDEISL